MGGYTYNLPICKIAGREKNVSIKAKLFKVIKNLEKKSY